VSVGLDVSIKILVRNTAKRFFSKMTDCKIAHALSIITLMFNPTFCL